MSKFIKKYKVLLIIVLIFIMCLGGFIVFSKNNVYIEIASDDILYTFAPNAQTIVKIKVGDKVDLNVITSSIKKHFVKCYSTNETLIEFDTNSSFKALSEGETTVYCDLFNSHSNYMNVKIS